ncbi:RidA family protein [Comamonas thiooxydans]|uniref:Endoribonuclease L-PSP n=1 Tax=Comamonas thiooxydans TaxID=363952 RepID=A0A0E3BUM7_9BURK|nr:RidA family protein [Comamonas thiooxydans]KGH11604.1 endoribonuclease L-PSP [Comamonas thiooxydans]KGH21207.1 endoribonuclease L-PSP [Comamonas thiooxydans]KGH24615.1 endoribonuclease L-PSP [Comamonas thiooxydans]
MDAKPSFIAPAPQPCYLQPAGLYDSLPNGYTHVVTVQEPLRWLFVSGQGGENALAELPDSFALQAAQALANIKTALDAGGADMGHVLKLIVDHSLERFEHWQSAVRQHWGSGEPGDKRPRFPACTLIPVPKLALPGMLIEVEATAALPMAVGAKAATPA